MKEQLQEITERLEQGIKEVFESEKYKEYLNTMSKFYNYSFNNTMLIAMQKPEATLVAGFNAWKEKFDRHVIKGEKGIRIIAPAPIKRREEVEKIDPVTEEPVIDDNGKPVMEVIETTTRAFKVIPVFDVSQTDGKPLPELTVEELNGEVKDFDLFMEALTQVAPVPIVYEDIADGAKGYYHLEDKRIAIQEGMSQIQTVKTAIHETAHAKLHGIDLNHPENEIPQEQKKDRKTKEVEAESIAYTVCQHYGIDTSDYLFGYVAGWSSGKELDELRSSLETIRSTAATLIKEIDAKVAELELTQKELQTEVLQESASEIPQKPLTEEEKLLTGKEDSFDIYQLKAGEELHYHRFEGLERLQKHGLNVEKDNYELIYTAPLKEGQTLDDIFEEFNMFRPEDFKGHSLSVSDIVMIHKDGENHAQYVDSFGLTEISDFLEQKRETELAFAFDDRYLMIHECDEGYDYTFFDKNYKEMDGGVYDNPDISIREAVHIILTDDPFPQGERRDIDYQELEEKVEAANVIITPAEEVEKPVSFLASDCIPQESLNLMSKGEIQETVLAYAQSKIDEIGAEVTIKEARVYGSRSRGLEHEGSDVDVVLSYSGDMREDAFFNLLHEDGLQIGGIPVDINPISEEKTGSIEDYLEQANKYLDEKENAINQQETVKEEPKQTLTFYVAECSEFHSLGAFYDNLTLEEAVKAFQTIPPERMNGVKGLGFHLHTEGQELHMDSEYDILTGKAIDVDLINHIEEFRDNPLVQQAVKEVIEHFPEAEVWDRETRAKETVQTAEVLQSEAEQTELDFDLSCNVFAVELDQFAQQYDSYGYRDYVDSREDNIHSIVDSLQSGDIDEIKQWLQEVIDDEEPKEDVANATELLSRIDDLAERREQNPLVKVEELEEANYNQIDGRLNNLKPKAEEQKEKISIMEKLQVNKEKTTKQNQPEKVEKKQEISMD